MPDTQTVPGDVSANPRVPTPEEEISPEDMPSDDFIQRLIQSEREMASGHDPKSLDGMVQYLSELRRFRVLTPEEEVALSRAARSGCSASEEMLVKHNLRFVVAVAKRYQGKGVNLEDLIQEGNCGLITAARRFDPERGVKFTSYAVWWIIQSICGGLASQQRFVRLPLNRVGEMTKIIKVQEEILRTTGRKAQLREIQERTGVPLHMVRILIRASKNIVSLDAPPSDGIRGGALAERVADENTLSMPACGRDEALEVAMGTLRDRDRQVLEMFFGLARRREHTLEEIGQSLGITRERARQLRDRALKELRESGMMMFLADYHVFPAGRRSV